MSFQPKSNRLNRYDVLTRLVLIVYIPLLILLITRDFDNRIQGIEDRLLALEAADDSGDTGLPSEGDSSCP